MKSITKKAFYSMVWASSLVYSQANAAINMWEGNVQAGIRGTSETADQAVQTLIVRFAQFLTIIAVVYLLWGWFNILTAGWDEEKVKKWKTVIIQSLIWLVVIWIASSVVGWLLTKILI